MRALLLVVVGVTSLMACEHMRAEDSTVVEHRNEAAIHNNNAQLERAQYQPQSLARSTHAQLGDFAMNEEWYNPTREHLAAADREFAEANAHLVAARSLIAFENSACAGMSEGERSSCPLLASSVMRVTSQPRGFRLGFKPDADVPAIYRRLSCHLAYAVATGFDRPSCPLFVKGLSLSRLGADVIEFAGDSDASGVGLRAQAMRVFYGSSTGSSMR